MNDTSAEQITNAGNDITIAAILPNGKSCTNVYQAYIIGIEEAQAEQAALIAELVEALENVVKCGEERNESGMDWEEIAGSRSQYISKKNIIACKALAKVK